LNYQVWNYLKEFINSLFNLFHIFFSLLSQSNVKYKRYNYE
jgi:hypothetical protein